MQKKRIWILTLFPDMFNVFKDVGVIGRYFSSDKAEINLLYMGDFSPKNFKGVDDSPYGGGPGMIIKADVLEAAINKIKENYNDFKNEVKVIYTSPRGEVFNNKLSRKLANNFENYDYVFICGRYEGIDERFIELYVDQIISLGDFVLSGGEVAVMTIIDSFTRFIPNVLGNQVSPEDDSFEDGLIEGPQYTRPAEFNGLRVPEVLSSGNHKLINEFTLKKRIEFTKKHRPDMYDLYLKKQKK